MKKLLKGEMPRLAWEKESAPAQAGGVRTAWKVPSEISNERPHAKPNRRWRPVPMDGLVDTGVDCMIRKGVRSSCIWKERGEVTSCRCRHSLPICTAVDSTEKARKGFLVWVSDWRRTWRYISGDFPDKSDHQLNVTTGLHLLAHN